MPLPEGGKPQLRLVLVWVVAIFTIAMLIVAWCTTQPLVVKVTNTSDEILDNLGTNTTGWEQTKVLNLYVANMWPVPLIIVTLLWAIISSQTTDPESVVYG